MTPRVVMVAGAYYPELAGGSLQARTLVQALREKADVSVFTTTADRTLPAEDTVEGVRVRRVFVDPTSMRTKAAAAARLLRQARRAFSDRDIVHFHGITEKVLPLLAIAKLSGRRAIAKLTSVGWDDPVSLRDRRFGSALAAAVKQLDRVIAVSPAMADRCLAAGVDAAAVQLIPNGVDTGRFRPADPSERRTLRASLGLPLDSVLTTFVGFWSLEKGPHLVFDAWRAASQRNTNSALLFIGERKVAHPEVDGAMVADVERRIAAEGLTGRVTFIDRTTDVAPYLRASDVFVLPSAREGLPNALLEAMACGVPPLVTHLPGVTDFVVESDVNGIAVDRDVAQLTAPLEQLINHDGLRSRLGAGARRTIVERFSIEMVARQYVALYRMLLEPARC